MYSKAANFLHKNYSQKLLKQLLILLWIGGAILGCFSSLHISDSTLHLMRSSFSGDVSIVWLLFAANLPLVLSYTAIRFRMPVLLLPLIFLKSYTFSLCFSCVAFAFGSAGWLMRVLCLSPDICSTLLLVWFLLNNYHYEQKECSLDFWICVAVNVMIGFIEYFMVSPFTVSLLND